jgi:hypothetical protein
MAEQNIEFYTQKIQIHKIIKTSTQEKIIFVIKYLFLNMAHYLKKQISIFLMNN